MPLPFEVPFADILANIDAYVDEVFASLRSDFITMPKGEGFIEYPVFEAGYEALKRATDGFQRIDAGVVMPCVSAAPITTALSPSFLCHERHRSDPSC